MLAAVRSSAFRNIAARVLAASAALVFASCATKQPPPLVADGSAGGESALPWNEQQKWENSGQFGQMTEQMQNRR